MAEKKKISIEYEVKSSPKILFGFLSEPNGLAQWFADDVRYKDQIFTFVWDGEEHKAKRIAMKENKSVRFRFMDDDPAYYFEMEIVQDELTNDVALCITDFAPEDAIQERRLIWDNQIEYLISVLGA